MTNTSRNALECQLLCASNAAYGLAFTDTANFQPLPPYFAKAGFVDAPTPFVGGPQGIHGGLLGTILDPTLPSSGTAVTVVFRGTHPPSIRGIPDVASFLEDWANNFDAAPIRVAEVPGHVHAGFWAGVQSLWTPAFVTELRRRVAASTSQRLYVTGHSKGGAMAHLAGLRLISELGILPTAVVSFAGARPGTQDFADAYQARVSAIRRYEYGDDLVPHLPPSALFVEQLQQALQRFEAMSPALLSLFREPADQPLETARLLRVIAQMSVHNYVSVGELHYLSPFGDAVGDLLSLRIRRALSLARLLALGRFRTIGYEHSIDCGSGYLDEVCPHDICG